MAEVRRQKKTRTNPAMGFLLFLAKLAAAVAAALFIILYCFWRVPVSGSSMEPAVQAGSTVFVNRLVYLFRNPERYDIAMFRDESGTVSVKRIIGLPGETVTISDTGEILIDGEEPEGMSDYVGTVNVAGRAGGSGVTLGDDEYFVIGDNPSRSQDSRSASPGNVSGGELEGLAWLSVEWSGLPGFRWLVP